MFIGLDIGTSSVKAVLLDANDAILGQAEQPITVSRPKPDWSEQDPEHWWAATVAAMDALAAAHPAEVASVTGLGLSGQMHGATLLDKTGAVLRPGILWNDGRSARQCAALEAAVPDLRSITGNIAFPGFTAPKLLWVKENEPEIFAKVATVLLPKAYVRYRLCGTFVEDMSDASGTLWLDVGRRDWSDAMLSATGLSRANMPRLVEGTEASGEVAPDLCRRWGMLKPPVVAGGAGDNAAAAVGLGAVKPGDAFLSLGTSGVLWVTTDRFLPNPASAVHAFCHAVPHTWHQMGVMLSAASAFGWLSKLLGEKEADLLAAVGDTVAGPSPVQFLPYLSGERTPHNDVAARGAFAGLSHDTERPHLTQAVLEGVAFATRDNLEALKAAGSSVKDIALVGGGSRSRLWASILADTLGVPVFRVKGGEVGGALGAARLGRIAATGEAVEAVCPPPARAETFEPHAGRQAAYDAAYASWRRFYPAMREVRAPAA